MKRNPEGRGCCRTVAVVALAVVHQRRGARRGRRRPARERFDKLLFLPQPLVIREAKRSLNRMCIARMPRNTSIWSGLCFGFCWMQQRAGERRSQLMNNLKAEYQVEALAQGLEVSPSGFYAHQHKSQGVRSAGLKVRGKNPNIFKSTMVLSVPLRGHYRESGVVRLLDVDMAYIALRGRSI